MSSHTSRLWARKSPADARNFRLDPAHSSKKPRVLGADPVSLRIVAGDVAVVFVVLAVDWAGVAGVHPGQHQQAHACPSSQLKSAEEPEIPGGIAEVFVHVGVVAPLRVCSTRAARSLRATGLQRSETSHRISR